MEGREFMDGNFWKKHALEDLIPYWYENVRDDKNGGFHSALSRDWKPIPPWERIPAMISRQVFSFSSAYLISGDEKYIEAARKGVDYLLAHGWDEKYGGWFAALTRTGEPKDTSKLIAVQLYTNVGLTLYYFATGDRRALSYVMKSVEIHKTNWYDGEYGGYYQSLNRDLSVRDSGKNKHAHYGYVSSLLLNLWLAKRDPEVLRLSSELTDLSIERMLDAETGWIHGYVSVFDRRWKLSPGIVDGIEVTYIGAQQTAALSFLRLYHQTGNKLYLEQGKRLGDKINRAAWNPERGEWLDLVENVPPYGPTSSPRVMWWVHIYGCFLQLQLYRVTGEDQYLERFRKSEIYYDRYLRDRKYGGVLETVTPDGKLIGEGRKACSWHTSYHEIEHCLLNMLYLNLYVNGKPAVLHFKLNGDASAEKHFVSPVDDPSVHIAGVKINGRAWTKFDSEDRSVTLPGGKDLKVEVTLSPAENQ